QGPLIASGSRSLGALVPVAPRFHSQPGTQPPVFHRPDGSFHQRGLKGPPGPDSHHQHGTVWSQVPCSFAPLYSITGLMPRPSHNQDDTVDQPARSPGERIALGPWKLATEPTSPAWPPREQGTLVPCRAGPQSVDPPRRQGASVPRPNQCHRYRGTKV